jgi:class 3 adenylate cyclase/predicted ATPase
VTFDEVLDQVRELLQQRGRVTYRSLKLRYQLDDELLTGVIDELISAERVAADEDGKVLVWVGEAGERAKTTQEPCVAPRITLHAPRAAEGERRQLTVMFIDLVGSTTLSQQLDPEDYHARVVAYQTACRQVIARYEGHIAQYLGDGVLVYFGYPQAHEEDAVRAVRSGLEIVTAVRQLAYTPALQVRIGIHTGPVVVGEIGAGVRTERLALGETPNLAARVQGVAEPDTVVMSGATSQLVQGLFACHDLGSQTVKGFSTPVSLYRIVGESAAQSRFEAAVRTGLTPLVGRAEELELLQRRWHLAKAGAGQVVLLSGEPGIGKSRLVQELAEQLAHEGATRIEFRCSPYHQNSALYPIIDHLQRLLQFAREDAPATKLEKLQHTLSHYHFPQAETLSLLAALLSLPHPKGSPPITVSPQKQKEKTQAAVVTWLVEEAERQLVYNVWEDLHWADPSTLEVLTLLVDQVPTTRLLALLTFRPEFLPPWGNRSHLSQLTLSRLGRPQVEAMVVKVTGEKVLPSEVLQQIVAKTDGVPLFVEELTKTVVESEFLRETADHYELTGPLPPLAIPSTLQDSLMARLDRLGTVREIAQLGATVGREFSYELLQAVSLLDEETLQHGLKQLVEAELVYQHGLVPQAQYLFKHALIQDAAYQSLLKSTRQQYHQQIARALAEHFPETVETQPELLAYHYTAAGLIEQAIPYWQQAGQRATQHSANLEALNHLTTGLDLLKTLPETPERAQQELTLHLAQGGPLVAIKGPAAPEVGAAYAHALALCRQVGETPQLFPALAGLRVFYTVRGEIQTARELGEQLLRIAQRVQDPALLVEAHYALGATLGHLGEGTRAREHLEQGIAFCDLRQQRSSMYPYGVDLGVIVLACLPRVLWVLGYPQQARERSRAALTLAQEMNLPFSTALAWVLNTELLQFLHEAQAMQQRAEALSALCHEQGFSGFFAGAIILPGWARAMQGREEEGIQQIHQGLATVRATGTELHRPYHLALLAEAYGKTGQEEEGLTALVEALAAVDRTGERWCEAELYRLKGQLIFQQERQRATDNGPQRRETDSRAPMPDAQGEAEACFQKAIEIARPQQAKSLELRAAMSLARLWQQQGKRREAHEMLAEIYGWFTEGFDTKDLQEAKVLLEELT